LPQPGVDHERLETLVVGGGGEWLATNVYLVRPAASPAAPLAVVFYETSPGDKPVLRWAKEDLSVRCQCL